jgi:hypothetical protein
MLKELMSKKKMERNELTKVDRARRTHHRLLNESLCANFISKAKREQVISSPWTVPPSNP